jgi:hypothetical protein
MLGLVAPITMSADQQALWIASAVDALQDIRAAEVAEISMEVRRTVTRPSQIVPEIAKLVAERRKRANESARRAHEYEEDRKAIPVRRHIANRDRRNFTAEDWAELNEYLESVGAKARYRADGSRYFIDGAAQRTLSRRAETPGSAGTESGRVGNADAPKG